MSHMLSRIGVVAALGLAAAPVSAFSTFIDELLIMRSNPTGTAMNTYFHDTFGDGLPPPAVEANPGVCGMMTLPANCYGVAGIVGGVSGVFPANAESGGKLKLDTAFGAPSASAIGTPTLSQRARLLTSRVDNTAADSPGLQIGRAFSASAVFDLAIPAPGESYSLRFTDAHADTNAAGHQNDFLQVMVRTATTPGAVPEINFRKQDFQLGEIIPIEATPLNLAIEADQIMLKLDHATAGSNIVSASWAYLNDGAIVSSGQFATTGTIFTGESWTRVDFIASEVIAVVPEPETYAMMLAGLGLLGWRLRRHTRRA